MDDDASPCGIRFADGLFFFVNSLILMSCKKKKKKKEACSESDHQRLATYSSAVPCGGCLHPKRLAVPWLHFFPLWKKWKDNWTVLEKDTHWAMWGLLHSICMLYGNIDKIPICKILTLRVGGQHILPTQSISSWRLGKIRALLFDESGMRLNNKLRHRLDF